MSRLKHRYPTSNYVWEIVRWFPAHPKHAFVTELATMVAEEAVGLGYFSARRLSAEEWAQLRLNDLRWCRERDWRKGDLDEWAARAVDAATQQRLRGSWLPDSALAPLG